MSKAEELALQYCKDMNYILPNDTERSLEANTAISAYIKGFKDGHRNKLSVEDIERIITIENDMIEQYDRAMLDQMSDEEYYTEMLKRFNEE